MSIFKKLLEQQKSGNDEVREEDYRAKTACVYASPEVMLRNRREPAAPKPEPENAMEALRKARQELRNLMEELRGMELRIRHQERKIEELMNQILENDLLIRQDEDPQDEDPVERFQRAMGELDKKYLLEEEPTINVVYASPEPMFGEYPSIFAEPDQPSMGEVYASPDLFN